MTTIQLTHNYFAKGYSFTLKPIFKFLKNTFKSVGSALILSRQCSANEKLVPYLLKEYPMETEGSLLYSLNASALKEHEKRMAAM